jgi:hypothetical protein
MTSHSGVRTPYEPHPTNRRDERRTSLTPQGRVMAPLPNLRAPAPKMALNAQLPSAPSMYSAGLPATAQRKPTYSAPPVYRPALPPTAQRVASPGAPPVYRPAPLTIAQRVSAPSAPPVYRPALPPTAQRVASPGAPAIYRPLASLQAKSAAVNAGGALEARPLTTVQRKPFQSSFAPTGPSNPASATRRATPVVQRRLAISDPLVGGNRVFYGPEDVKYLAKVYGEELNTAASSIEYLQNAPTDLTSLLADERTFYINVQRGEQWAFTGMDVAEAPKEKSSAETRTVVTNSVPGRIERNAEKLQALEISGLISCIGILILVAGADGGVDAACSSHLVTGMCSEISPEDENKRILNFRGKVQLADQVTLARAGGRTMTAVVLYVQMGEVPSGGAKDAVALIPDIIKHLKLLGVTNFKKSIGPGKRTYTLDAAGKASLSK